MKNKGFTLVELLAIIGILSVITVITIPTIDSTIKKNKEKLFNQQIETIRNGLKTWGDANVDRLPEESGDTLTLNLGYMKAEGFVKPDLVNPKNKQCYANDIKLYIKRVNENYEYIVDFESGSEATEYDCNAGDLIYTDSILNGADPILSNGLIPVTIEDNGTVKRADIYSEWYNYSEKKWANAVILTPTGKVETDGTILESSIESYFVWVPRYRYKLFDMGDYSSINTAGLPSTSNSKEIEIKFENKYTEISIGTKVGEFHSHPAFQAFDSNGLWVGKFETTGSLNNVTIKPNNKAINYVSVKNMFTSAYNYKRNINSHMMKNIEWGATAYLSLSRYGKNNEVNINNNSELMTGYSSVVRTTPSEFAWGTASSITLPYNTTIGYQASTTGNITGIYDMSGGANEYMAAYLHGNVGDSDFTISEIENYGNKYFDIYPSDSASGKYYNRILGDATGELGPFYIVDTHPLSNWYEDIAYFVDPEYSWIMRGGIYLQSSKAGQLFFGGDMGGPDTKTGFRITLTN